ncbi:Thioesterase [Saccharomonospora azurea SZMC 14600]|nr:Thioesterase [Saccharomonospora azurea SZMC 14600]
MIAWMKTGGLLPEYVYTDSDLLAMAVELMRSDVSVRDTYHFTGGSAPVPVEMLYGADDAVIDPAAGEQWRAVCPSGLTVTTLPGGHFYTPDVWRRLPTRIAALTCALSTSD